jgi:DNA-binding transcriptional LysR family regulator
LNPNTGRPEIASDTRTLRAFVAAAEELHFTRAAARLFVAQQALSRDVARLEAQVGTPLFVRTTRRVTLTPEGERLLDRARPLLRAHDELVAEVLRPTRPVIVDLMSEGPRTALRILDAARHAAPDVEFRGRYRGGMGESFRLLRSAELDVAFGRADWQGQAADDTIPRELVRFEPLALLLPATHRLATLDAVPVADLRGETIDTNPGNPDAPEWSDIGTQLVALAGAGATPVHGPALGTDDASHHLVQQGLPILTMLDHRDVPGGVVRPIVEPVPIYPWSMAWRPGAHPAGLAAIRDAGRTMARANDWLTLPDGAWLPEPEASRLGRS